MNSVNVSTESLKEIFSKDSVFVFIGQSGCGKETQSKALISFIKKISPGREIFFSETGGLYRSEIPFISLYNKKIIESIQSAGKLQSWIVTSALWAHNFLYNYNGGIIVIDGSPRSLNEAKAFIDFYHTHAGKEIFIFEIEISDKEARKRIIFRNNISKHKGEKVRSDSDTEEKIKTKLAYFHTDVKPALQYLSSLLEFKGIHFTKVNGEGGPKAVTNRILRALQSFH